MKPESLSCLIMSTAFISILAAVLVTMIAVALQNPNIKFSAVAETNLVTAFTSISNIVFAYGKSLSQWDSLVNLTLHSQPQHLFQYDD